MAGAAAAIVHALKYGGWSGLAEAMGARMAEVSFSRPVEVGIDGVVPVPLSAARLRERGFNQAELLARAVAAHRRQPLLANALTRARDTRHQARLTSSDRRRNVSGAFAVSDGAREEIQDKHILLVDDVLTTAATAQDCVRALCFGGARSVSLLTFARARPELQIKSR
jgi:ComF family protein